MDNNIYNIVLLQTIDTYRNLFISLYFVHYICYGLYDCMVRILGILQRNYIIILYNTINTAPYVPYMYTYRPCLDGDLVKIQIPVAETWAGIC